MGGWTSPERYQCPTCMLFHALTQFFFIVAVSHVCVICTHAYIRWHFLSYATWFLDSYKSSCPKVLMIYSQVLNVALYNLSWNVGFVLLCFQSMFGESVYGEWLEECDIYLVLFGILVWCIIPRKFWEYIRQIVYCITVSFCVSTIAWRVWWHILKTFSMALTCDLLINLW